RENAAQLPRMQAQPRHRSREAPSVATIEAAAELLDRVEYPVWFHCKSGADRAGLMAALYMLLREGADIQTAQRQLSLRFGHFKQGKTGVLDAFLAAYAQAAAERPDLDFLTWVRTEYRPEVVKQQFHEDRWTSFLVDRVLARE
ncbi:MAG: tyrosine-protein phosphatase, partial [Pseudomonadota bacterium]